MEMHQTGIQQDVELIFGDRSTQPQCDKENVVLYGRVLVTLNVDDDDTTVYRKTENIILSQ